MLKQLKLPSICEWVNKLWTFGVLIQKWNINDKISYLVTKDVEKPPIHNAE